MSRLLTKPHLALPLFVLPLLFSLLIPDRRVATPPDAPLGNEEELVTLVEDLKASLSITQPISIEILPRVEKLVSIQPTDRDRENFVLRFDRSFLAGLEASEVEAVVAHELGHLLIFTQHPYLQTETLANRHALQVVSRESLRSAYTKVWAQTGRVGSMNDFLGP